MRIDFSSKKVQTSLAWYREVSMIDVVHREAERAFSKSASQK
jgi:hypothetical protein